MGGRRGDGDLGIRDGHELAVEGFGLMEVTMLRRVMGVSYRNQFHLSSTLFSSHPGPRKIVCRAEHWRLRCHTIVFYLSSQLLGLLLALAVWDEGTAISRSLLFDCKGSNQHLVYHLLGTVRVLGLFHAQ